ncbi:MAG: hypothetical protein HYV41_01630 [Candidatus Magasanikbacteria bacterium]|nr:hypothetical protein [Candidatus Magasanikbacteria bacterium]
MYNWNTDTTELKKDPEKYAIWKLEQLVNFGLHGEKISRSQLTRYWDELTLDPKKKKYLSFLLWGKQS